LTIERIASQATKPDVARSFLELSYTFVPMKKLLYLAILLLAGHYTLHAQIELVPLSENVAIQHYLQEQESKSSKTPRQPQLAIEKSVCNNLTQPNVTYVQAGVRRGIKIQIDTAGLGRVVGTYGCSNCQFAEFGTAEIRNDSLFYTAKTDIEAGEDRIQVNFCTGSTPDSCRSRTYRIVARRNGRTHPVDMVTTVNQNATYLVTANVSMLPGRKAACSSFINCETDYDGRYREVAFMPLDATKADGRISYRSDYNIGVDSVCAVMCDTFGVCDTFQFAFRITSGTDEISIPFFEDFSYVGPYPDSLWADRDIFVNNDMADTPPSFGVATFDGLNRDGSAYGGAFGESDRLTSKYINLSNVREDVYLTYWVQRRGFGDRPELRDSFLVEFKNKSGNWIRVDALPGIPANESDTARVPFRFRSIKVPNELKSSTFQFRFKNLSDRTGLLDVWHLDYVRMDRSVLRPDSTFDDFAFTRHPNFILERYSSMPWKQFRVNRDQELMDSISVGVWNHAVETRSVLESSVALNENISNLELFKVTLFNDQQQSIPNTGPQNRIYLFQRDSVNPPLKPVLPSDAFKNLSKNIGDSTLNNYNFLSFRLTYSLANNSEQKGVGYEAVKRNNSVNRDTYFSNYFSYDDGTAEAGLIAQQGIQIAMQYRLNTPDTLRALQFHFPRTTVNIADQLFDIKVWKDTLDNTPEYEATGQRAYYANLYVKEDTLQGFTTYRLQKNGRDTFLLLPAGNFYIGWEQASPCEGTRCIPVGYDRNTSDGTQYLRRNINGRIWETFPRNFSTGALMIRPVFGSNAPPSTVPPVVTATDDLQKPQRNFRLFPNPTQNVLNITPSEGNYEDFQFLIYNSTGQQMLRGALQPQLQVQDLPAGIYFIKIADRRTQQIWNEKFIIAK